MSNPNITATKHEDALEELIDRHGLREVLSTIASVCFAKADHLSSNWQDEDAARVWARAGRSVDNLTTLASVRDLSG